MLGSPNFHSVFLIPFMNIPEGFKDLGPKSTPFQASPNFENCPWVCPKLVPGPRDGRPWSQGPARDRMSTLGLWDWTGSQTDWGHWNIGPSVPHLAQSPCPVPVNVQRPGTDIWTQNPLHSRLAQILEIFQGSVSNLSQGPGMDILGPNVPHWTNGPFLKVQVPVHSTPGLDTWTPGTRVYPSIDGPPPLIKGEHTLGLFFQITLLLPFWTISQNWLTALVLPIRSSPQNF